MKDKGRKTLKTRKAAMMDNNCKIDFMNKEIRITKKFYKESQRFGTKAFDMMLELQAKLPNFRILVQEAPKCHTYMPTYYQMEDTIRMMAEDFEAAMREWDEVRNLARMTGKGYNMVRSWFVAKYDLNRIGYEKEYMAA